MSFWKSRGILTLQQLEMAIQVILIRGEIENFGKDSEVGQFLRNNEDTQGYENLQTTTDVDVFEIFPKEQISRGRNGKTTKFSTI